MRLHILLQSLFLLVAGAHAADKCDLDVDISCMIQEESSPYGSECMTPQNFGLCYEEATVTYTVCASAKKQKKNKAEKKSGNNKLGKKEGRKDNTIKSFIKVNGIKSTSISVLDHFDNAGKFVVGVEDDTDAKTCVVVYTEVINTCTTPIPTVSAKLVAKDDTNKKACVGSGNYGEESTNDGESTIETAAGSPLELLSLTVYNPSSATEVGIQGYKSCGVSNPIALVAGLAAAGFGFATATAPIGWMVYAAASSSSVGAFAGSMTCQKHKIPTKSTENIHDTIRRIVKYINFDTTFKLASLYTRKVDNLEGKLHEYSHQDIENFGFTSLHEQVYGWATTNKILAGEMIGELALVQANIDLVQLTKLEPGKCILCKARSRNYLERVNMVIRLLEDAKQEFEENFDANVKCESYCAGRKCWWYNFGYDDTTARCYPLNKDLSPKIEYEVVKCVKISCLREVYTNLGPQCQVKTCGSTKELEQQVKSKARNDWDTMIDQWWNGRGEEGDDNYVKGVRKSYDALVRLRDANTNFLAVCGSKDNPRGFLDDRSEDCHNPPGCLHENTVCFSRYGNDSFRCNFCCSGNYKIGIDYECS